MQSGNEWQTALSQTFEQLTGYLTTQLPALLGALALLIVGWVIAWLLGRVAASLVRLCNRMWNRAGAKLSDSKSSSIKNIYVKIIQRAVFWIVMLFFVAAASSNLGLIFVADGLRTVLGYLPQLIAGLFIIIGGYYVAGVVELMARSAFDSSKVSQSIYFSSLIKWFIVFTFGVIGINQLGINIQFVTNFLIVISGVLLLGVALAFGLGSRELVANLLAIKQMSKHIKQDDWIQIGNVHGKLVSLTPTMLVLETAQGRTLLPAKLCLDNIHGTHISTRPIDQQPNSQL